jgi:hypothetical protein
VDRSARGESGRQTRSQQILPDAPMSWEIFAGRVIDRHIVVSAIIAKDGKKFENEIASFL